MTATAETTAQTAAEYNVLSRSYSFLRNGVYVTDTVTGCVRENDVDAEWVALLDCTVGDCGGYNGVKNVRIELFPTVDEALEAAEEDMSGIYRYAEAYIGEGTDELVYFDAKDKATATSCKLGLHCIVLKHDGNYDWFDFI
jgi:hypothetical protein